MTNNTKAMNEAVLISLMKDLESLSRAAKSVKEKLIKLFPAKYGSDLWWEKETMESLAQYKKGEYRSFSSADELIKDLNS